MKTRRTFVYWALFLGAHLAPLAGAEAAPPAAAPAAAAETAETAAPAAPKTPVVPLSPRFQLVRNRIDVLFTHRNSAPPPLDPRHNPFRPAGAFIGPASTDSRGGTGAEPQASDVTLLQQSVASLKMGGVVEKGGQHHLVVNSRLFKEGDVIQTLVQGQAVYLRVRALTAKSLTLALNEAEMTLKF